MIFVFSVVQSAILFSNYGGEERRLARDFTSEDLRRSKFLSTEPFCLREAAVGIGLNGNVDHRERLFRGNSFGKHADKFCFADVKSLSQ